MKDSILKLTTNSVKHSSSYITQGIPYKRSPGLDELAERVAIAYFFADLEYQLMKIIQYRKSNAIMLIQYGFSKTGFGSVFRYAITLIVTIAESVQTTIFRSLLPSIMISSRKLYLGELKEYCGMSQDSDLNFP